MLQSGCIRLEISPLEILNWIVSQEQILRNDDIEKVSVGNYLLLLATDEEGKVRLQEFRLTEREFVVVPL